MNNAKEKIDWEKQNQSKFGWKLLQKWRILTFKPSQPAAIDPNMITIIITQTIIMIFFYFQLIHGGEKNKQL